MRNIYSKEYLGIYRKMGYMHPDVYRYRSGRMRREHNITEPNERRSGKTINKCMDTCWSIIRGESVIYVTTSAVQQNRVVMEIENILIGGFQLEKNVATLLERVRFVSKYNFNRTSFFEAYRGFIKGGNGSTKIIIDID